MSAEHTRLTHRIAIQLYLVAESYTICSSRPRRPVEKLLDTPSYSHICPPTNLKRSKVLLQFHLYKWPTASVRRHWNLDDGQHPDVACRNKKCVVINLRREHSFLSPSIGHCHKYQSEEQNFERRSCARYVFLNLGAMSTPS
jgi:hypothetical protein